MPWVERRLRWAALIISIGLLVQLLTLTKIHPLAFVAFILIGSPLVFAGIVLYLFSIVSKTPEH